MKVTIKIQPEQLRELINFVHGLTGKGVKVKQVCSKMELTEIDVKVKTPKENNKTFVSGKKITSVNYDMPIINLNNEIEVKDEEVLKFPGLEKERDDLSNIIDALNISEYEKSIHGEGLRCYPNYVKGTLYNCNGKEETKCDNCSVIKVPEINKETVCQRGCWVDYGTKSALKNNDCKCDISKNFDEIVKTIQQPNQNKMYFGSASVIPNKQWIDEND